MPLTREVHADGWCVRVHLARQVLALDIPEFIFGRAPGAERAGPLPGPLLRNAARSCDRGRPRPARAPYAGCAGSSACLPPPGSTAHEPTGRPPPPRRARTPGAPARLPLAREGAGRAALRRAVDT